MRFALLLFFAFAAMKGSGQSSADVKTVEVTYNKTSSIIFNSGITSVDRGSRDVLAQKAKGVNNVLQLKAGRINFKETNLTVITSDGKLHHFTVSYADRPRSFTMQVNDTGASEKGDVPMLFQTQMTSSEMERYAEGILNLSQRGALSKTVHYGMKLSLQGIFIEGNVMFYHLRIANRSNIPFHTDMLRFYVKDKQNVKRTASQEISVLPLFIHGNADELKGATTQDVIVALEKFTIPDAKVLAIELLERKGGRHLKLLLKNRTIIRAQPVPDN
ncbi:MAG: conjugative transposon protein TraN [Cyclobacteriaceae bacterium]|nr:conjugative transposon protein TraN [Cyclobacteriaceae bacterium]